MGKKLLIIVSDLEYREIQHALRSRNISVAEWVRQAIRFVLRNKPSDGTGKKLEALGAAMRHEFPTTDVDRMLAEIERGYGLNTNPLL